MQYSEKLHKQDLNMEKSDKFKIGGECIVKRN